MDNSVIAINQIIRDKTDIHYRILWVEDTYLYWIPLLPNHNTPKYVLIRDLENGLNSGEYFFAFTSNYNPPEPKNLSAAIERRDHIWSLISEVVTQEPAVYDIHKRQHMLKEVEAKSGVKVPNLYPYLGKYWRGGKVPNALFPDYSNVGKTKDSYSEKTKKPGRKGIPGTAGKKLVREDLAHFEEAYQTFYITRKETLQDTYNNMLGAYYSTHDENGKIKDPFPPEKVPSLSQFYYWHSKKKKVDELIATTDEKKFNLNYRGGTEKTETHLYGPCALSQIDATIADVYLVRQDDRTAIVGRPTVYFVLDAFSHIVTGIHISLKKPSWNEAAIAILNSQEDKTEFCHRYGLDISPLSWPCYHLPRAIVGDRGEMDGYAVEKIVNEMGITIQNTPPYRGDLKGIVESHFKVLNYSYAKLPGYVDSDFGKRCTEDYRLDAVLDIVQFTQIVIRCVLFHNNYHYMLNYPKSTIMRQFGILSVPKDIWMFGIKHLSGSHQVVSKTRIRYALLPKGIASITRSGIEYNGLWYTCEQAEKEHWFAEARIEGRSQISISYDPRDMAFIYIKYNNDPEPIECHLVEYQGEMVGITHEEAAEIKKYDEQERKKYEYTEHTEKAKLNQEIAIVVSNAEKMAAGAPKKSNAARIGEIKENCAQEIKAQIENATKESITQINRPIVTDASSTTEEIPDPLEAMFQSVFERTENQYD